MWVSFTLEDSTRCCLRSKEPLAAAVKGLLGRQGSHLAAVLVNCCAPGAVTAALPVLKQHVPPGAAQLPPATCRQTPRYLFSSLLLSSFPLFAVQCVKSQVSGASASGLLKGF